MESRGVSLVTFLSLMSSYLLQGLPQHPVHCPWMTIPMQIALVPATAAFFEMGAVSSSCSVCCLLDDQTVIFLFDLGVNGFGKNQSNHIQLIDWNRRSYSFIFNSRIFKFSF